MLIEVTAPSPKYPTIDFWGASLLPQLSNVTFSCNYHHTCLLLTGVAICCLCCITATYQGDSVSSHMSHAAHYNNSNCPRCPTSSQCHGSPLLQVFHCYLLRVLCVISGFPLSLMEVARHCPRYFTATYWGCPALFQVYYFFFTGVVLHHIRCFIATHPVVSVLIDSRISLLITGVAVLYPICPFSAYWSGSLISGIPHPITWVACVISGVPLLLWG